MVICEQDLNDEEERNNLTRRTEKNEGQEWLVLREWGGGGISQRATETTSGKAYKATISSLNFYQVQWEATSMF